MASRFCSFQETGTVLCKLTPSHIYNLHNKRFMATITRGQNLVEKIVQKHLAENSSSDPVFSGDFVSVSPAYVMTHDNTAAVMQKYHDLHVKKLHNPSQAVFTLDHNFRLVHTEKNMKKYRSIEQFASSHGVTFYPAGAVLHARSILSTQLTSLAVGTPIVRTDACSIWATGQTWWQIPRVAKVILEGTLRPGVTGKDVIITLCGGFNNDEVLNHAIEFVGTGISSLSVDERLTIANMTTEWGALAGIFPVDERLTDWFTKRHDASKRKETSYCRRITSSEIKSLRENPLYPDVNARYAKVLTLDLSTVEPHVSGPNDVKTMHRLCDIAAKRLRVDKAYLVSCVNSRAEDIARAAKIVRNKRIAQNVEFYVAPASSEVLEESQQTGDWQALIDAGAIPLPSGCGPCIGLGKGLLQDGEVGISATNRNFRGRMGSRHAEAYLASPEVVAASAIAGFITGPEEWLSKSSSQSLRITQQLQVVCANDNINTDGIYPGKYTYQEDITPDIQAKVVMENYDETFSTKVRAGDILLTGYNFGTGSSREQAATALKHAGITLVLCGSVNETYKRNALNNGLLVLETPSLLNDVKSKFTSTEETRALFTLTDITIDIASGQVQWGGNTYSCSSVGRIAQELVLAGGLEGWVRNHINF
eukprot:gene2286-5280_t